jgi:hypothetical protein
MATRKKVGSPITRLNLKQLAQATTSYFPEIIKRANTQCHVIRKQYAVGSRDGFQRTYRKDRTFYNEMRVYMSCTDGKRASFVRFFGPPSPDTPCWVFCSCQYFTYNLEVALTRQNTSSIKFSNGQLPRERNVRMIPHLCKHLVLAARLALQQNEDKAAARMQVEAQAKTAAQRQQEAMEHPIDKRIPKGQFTSPRRRKGLIRIP